MQRNLDKDDIRDASDLLTHIDGWEKTGSYDAEAIEPLLRDVCALVSHAIDQEPR